MTYTRIKRFIKFAIVGGIGLPINLGLTYGFKESGAHYVLAYFLALLISITINYIFNHYWTFNHSKEKNTNMFKGWAKYILISMPLDLIAIGIAVALKETALNDYYYGYLLAWLTGIFCIMLVRYIMVSKYVWATSFKE